MVSKRRAALAEWSGSEGRNGPALQRLSACSARSLHPKLFHRKNFIPRTDIIQNYRVGGCQTLNLRLVLCRKDRQPPPTFGIIYRAVAHDRTNFGQALKVVAVSLHDISFAVGHRLDEVRARQDHFAKSRSFVASLESSFNRSTSAACAIEHCCQ